MIQIIGKITPPAPFTAGKYGDISADGAGLIGFVNNVVRLLIVIGGIWAFINLIMAGYGFLSAGDDPKKIEEAWKKIYQSMMGLLFILGSFVLAAIFSYLLFGDARTILNPKIWGPGQ